MNKSRLFFAIATIISFFAGYWARAGLKKYLQYDHAKFHGMTNIFSFHAASHLTSLNFPPLNQRTLFLVTRSGFMTNLHTAVTVSHDSVQLYMK